MKTPAKKATKASAKAPAKVAATSKKVSAKPPVKAKAAPAKPVAAKKAVVPAKAKLLQIFEAVGALKEGSGDKLSHRYEPGLALLHCNSSYPCEPRDCNLSAMHNLRPMCDAIGWSGHVVDALVLPKAVPEAVESAIWKLWQSGTRHHFCWPCLHCDKYFVPRFEQMRWPENATPSEAAKAAQLQCPHCGGLHQDADKHQRAAEHSVDEELDRGIDAALVAVHADHQGHRNQRHRQEREQQPVAQQGSPAGSGTRHGRGTATRQCVAARVAAGTLVTSEVDGE